MRLTIHGSQCDVEVVAEPFSIEGTNDQFAVHPCIERLFGMEVEALWTATHLPTGMAVARADDIDAAIASARAKWASKTPEQIANAIADGFYRTRLLLQSRRAS